MQVVVNQLLTSYRTVGSGRRKVLFLHGWADSSKTFDGLIHELTELESDASFILLDLPGFGGTQPPPDAWGLDEYAAFVADFLSKIKAEADVVVGHSNGGAIAISGLAQGVLDTGKLVLIASAGIREPNMKKSAMRLLSKPAKLAMKAAPKSTQKKIRHKLYSAVGSDYLAAEHMQETFKRVVATDVRQYAAVLDIPTCLIYGENDDATPPAYGKQLTDSIKGSVYNEIPLTGHFVHQEQARKVASLIDDFIKQ